MRETNDLYKKLWSMQHTVETMADIAGVQYDQNEIFNRRIYGGIYEKPTIGTCSSRTLELSVIPKEPIPRGAKIVIYARLRAGDEVSEWITQGTFFISKRPRDKRTGRIDITAYDSMRKANAYWLDSSSDYGDWSMTESQAVANIASRMGVVVDPRTVLDNFFPVSYPIDENGDMTMWSILAGIGVSNAGSWVVTADDRLLLIREGDIPAETSYLVNEDGDTITFGGVRIIV